MIFLISAKQGAGKSTLAKGLVSYMENAGLSCKLMKFAEPLYNMHNLIRNYLQSMGGDSLEPEKIDGPLLQLLGTEWGRKTRGEDIWANLAKAAVKRWEGLGVDHFVFDDARFPNELAAFPEAFKIRLNADQDVRMARADKWRPEIAHPSETSLDGHLNSFDLVIDTNVTTKEKVLESVIRSVKW